MNNICIELFNHVGGSNRVRAGSGLVAGQDVGRLALSMLLRHHVLAQPLFMVIIMSFCIQRASPRQHAAQPTSKEKDSLHTFIT